MRRASRLGATITGCLILCMALPVLTTFGMYNAGKPQFHAVVAVVALAGCMVTMYKDMRAEAAAFAVIALPGIISAMLGFLGVYRGDELSGTSAWIYMAGAALFVLLAFVKGSQARREAAGDSQ